MHSELLREKYRDGRCQNERQGESSSAFGIDAAFAEDCFGVCSAGSLVSGCCHVFRAMPCGEAAYKDECANEENKFEQLYYGHHGGLTPEEMEIPFLAI